MCTLKSRISVHVRLFILGKFSTLYGLIWDCTIIYFNSFPLCTNLIQICKIIYLGNIHTVEQFSFLSTKVFTDNRQDLYIVRWCDPAQLINNRIRLHNSQSSAQSCIILTNKIIRVNKNGTNLRLLSL